MKISAILHTSEYRGDHSADVARALDVNPNTMLGELVLKFLSSKSTSRDPGETTRWIEYRGAHTNDFIEIRVIGEGTNGVEVLGVTPEGEITREAEKEGGNCGCELSEGKVNKGGLNEWPPKTPRPNEPPRGQGTQ